MALLDCRLGEGFTGWVAQHGEPILVNDANSDPRGATIAGTDDVDESMLVVPMRYDERDDRGHHPVQARARRVRAGRPAPADDPRRPGRDRRRVGPLLTRTQDLAGELRRLLDMSAELSGSLDPRQVADLMAGHLARAMGVEECVISYWDRPAGRVESLGYFPPHRLQRDRAVLRGRRATPRRSASSSARRRSSSTPTTRRPTRPRSALMRRDGNTVLAMLPLVAKGQSIGLVELDSQRLGHVQTTSASRSPGRWPTRRRWRSRTPGSTRRPASSPTATR